MAIQEREARAYELMTVFIPDISEEDTQAQVEKVSTYISNAGGTVSETLTESPWGRRRLAYTIRFNGTDYRDGFYTVYHFDSAPSNLTELERDLKLDTIVMRYLLVHDDPKAGEKPTEGDDEAAETEGDTEATAAPAATATEAVPATEPLQDQAQPTETAPANAELTPEGAVATGAVTSDGGEATPTAEAVPAAEASPDGGDQAAEEAPAPESEPSAVAADTDTDETTDKE
ncbi:MAG: 30S ribosomal protein S6 [Chloroflexota bacterium]|nr:30S ribosomal protein S6 [Chloroflexota bacterium]